MDKQTAYRDLVKEVAACTACDPYVVQKKDETIRLEHDLHRRHINLWSEWQCSLDADILLIGQDFGHLAALEKDARACEERVDHYTKDNYELHKAQTDQNLRKLFGEALKIEIDEWPRNDRLFFTNSIQCYRTGNNNAPCNKKWFKLCNEKHISRLIDIIHPKVVIVMGRVVLEGILHCGTATKDDRPLGKDYFARKLNSVLDDGDFRLNLNSGFVATICPVSHTSPPAMNINRKYEKQLGDWKKIADLLQ